MRNSTQHPLRRFINHATIYFGRACFVVSCFTADWRSDSEATAAYQSNRTDAEQTEKTGSTVLSQTILAHDASVEEISCSPASGARVLSRSANGHIIVWDSDDHPFKLERVTTIDASNLQLRRVALDRTGLHLYGCHKQGIIEWEIDSGKTIKQIEVHDDVVTALYPVPGENQCVTSCADGSMILWNMATGTQIRRFGKSSLSKEGDDKKSQERDVRELDGHVGTIRDVVVTIDRKHVISAGDDPIVFIWDIRTGKLVDRLLGHDTGIVKLELSPSNRFVASVGKNNSILFWSLYKNERKLAFQWKSPGKLLPIIAIAPNDTVAVAGNDEGAIRILDFRKRSEQPKLRAKGPEIRSLLFVPDGNLICGTADGQILVWPATLGN